MKDLQHAGLDGAPLLESRLSREDGHMRVQLFGELDVASVPCAEAAILEAETQDVPLEVDLTGVEFIDSTGLRMLLRTRDRAAASGRRLRVRPAPPPADKIFALTGTDGLFDLLL